MDGELTFERSSHCANSCCVEVAQAPQAGKVYVRNSADPAVRIEFSAEEWRAFVAGVKGSEFDL